MEPQTVAPAALTCKRHRVRHLPRDGLFDKEMLVAGPAQKPPPASEPRPAGERRAYLRIHDIQV